MNLLKIALLACYLLHSAAHRFIFGFKYDGSVYMFHANSIPLKWVRQTCKENGGCKKINLYIPETLKPELIASGKAIRLGGLEVLTDTAPGLNGGWNFEKAVCEYYNIPWHYDNTEFWIAGDIRLNGEEVQVKFHGGEVLTMDTVEKQGWTLEMG